MTINRYKLVSRHNPVITKVDPLCPLTVGNGNFAFTADITGLQTFPEVYGKGTPICTQSNWGWHTKPVNDEKERYSLSDMKKEFFEVHGKKVGYLISSKDQEEIFHWLRQNPHRFHLGQIGLDIKKDALCPAGVEDIINPQHSLCLWSGIMNSSFFVGEHLVETRSACHPSRDILAFKIKSELIAKGRLSIKISFPYGNHNMTAADWSGDQKHSTEIISTGECHVCLRRIMDNTQYFVKIVYHKDAKLNRIGKNSFSITTNINYMELAVCFSPNEINGIIPSCSDTFSESKTYWQNYWNSGGVIDFEGSTDERANELERRVVLSQYLLAVQCAGSLPPQETGLTFNSWYGKFHLEMHWWHGVHFPLWGRTELFEKSLWWYGSILEKAKEMAKKQGYKGARWPKMTSYSGDESPSPIGPLLIWQQPHPIYYAELLYSIRPSLEILEKYMDIVFETAAFMSSYAEYDAKKNRYVLGPALIPAQENHKPQTVLNPTFELEYWAFGLQTANKWRKRLGFDINPEWDKIANSLADLPVRGGMYLAHENCPDTFSLYNYDHPSMLGALGMLSGSKVNHRIMLKTLLNVFDCWQMDKVWGWDFPLIAMTAARLGRPDLAVRALLHESPKNKYLANGHNKQADRKDLPVYLPGNGGLLTAVAMMTAGWKGCKESLPGFPKDGTWRIRYEGLSPML